MFQQLFHGQVYVFGYLPQQKGGDVSPRVKRDCRASPIGMAILFVGAALPHFNETESFQDRRHFARFEYR